jgi:hypothetical protein
MSGLPHSVPVPRIKKAARGRLDPTQGGSAGSGLSETPPANSSAGQRVDYQKAACDPAARLSKPGRSQLVHMTSKSRQIRSRAGAVAGVTPWPAAQSCRLNASAVPNKNAGSTHPEDRGQCRASVSEAARPEPPAKLGQLAIHSGKGRSGFVVLHELCQR